MSHSVLARGELGLPSVANAQTSYKDEKSLAFLIAHFIAVLLHYAIVIGIIN